MDEKPNPYAAPQSETAISPGEVWIRDHTGQLRIVHVGLSLVYYGIVLLILGVLVGVGGGLAAGQVPGVGGLGAVALVSFSGMGLAGLGAIFWFVGPLLCLPVPSESGAKGTIIVSVVLQFANFVISPIMVVFDLPFELGPWGPLVEGMIGPLAAVAGAVAFVLFMRQLALFIGQVELAVRSGRVLTGGILLVVLWLAALASAFTGAAESFAMIFGLGLLLGGLVLFVMYANLVNDLRKQLRAQITPQYSGKI